MPLTALERAATLARSAREKLDLLVIGGGIVGAAAAWDAAARGLNVLLVDKGDFASGASSKSSKLLHGGLRYLEMGHVGLVFESLSQRNRLFQDAPHVSKRLKFVLPVYRGGRNRAWILRAGLTLYDLLSHVTFPRGPWHRRLTPRSARHLEPALREVGLQAAFEYEDGQTEDARLVIETVKSAVACGARAINHARVTGFLRDEGGQAVGVRLQDELAPDAGPVAISAERILVACGPWTDVLLRLDDPQAPMRLRPTKGVHLVVDAFLTDHAVVLQSADPREAKPRLMFAIPWEGRTLLGTTDTDPRQGDDGGAYLDDDCEASGEETAYILAAANATFGVGLTPADVIASFGGWRPLVAPAESGLTASAVSREHEIFETPSGLVAIAGGKLTSYRTMARQAVDRIARGLPTSRSRDLCPSSIEEAALSGSELQGRDLEAWVASAAADPPRGLSAEAVATLARRYGTNWPVLRALVVEDPGLSAPLDAAVTPPTHWRVEVAYAVRHEGAALPEDFLMRRTRLFLLAPDQGLSLLDEVTTQMAELLGARAGWSEADQGTWVHEARSRYQRLVAQSRASRQSGQG